MSIKELDKNGNIIITLTGDKTYLFMKGMRNGTLVGYFQITKPSVLAQYVAIMPRNGAVNTIKTIKDVSVPPSGTTYGGITYDGHRFFVTRSKTGIGAGCYIDCFDWNGNDIIQYSTGLAATTPGGIDFDGNNFYAMFGTTLYMISRNGKLIRTVTLTGLTGTQQDICTDKNHLWIIDFNTLLVTASIYQYSKEGKPIKAFASGGVKCGIATDGRVLYKGN